MKNIDSSVLNRQHQLAFTRGLKRVQPGRSFSFDPWHVLDSKLLFDE
jgi:hypothetical protein